MTERQTDRVCIHPYFGFVMKPNAVISYSDMLNAAIGERAIVRTDRDGFRNSPRPEHKPEREVWIGVFGNSLAFSPLSLDNEHTLPGYLEASLRERTGKAVRVFNFALPGYRQPQILNVYWYFQRQLDGFVCIDGYNDVIVPLIWNKGRLPALFPFWPFYHRLYYSEDVTDTRSRFCVVDGDEPSRQIHDSLREWERATLAMDRLRIHDRQEALFVLQPVPEEGKALTELELAFLTEWPDWVAARKQYRQEVLSVTNRLQGAGVPFVDASSVFQSETRTTYADIAHLNHLGCKLLAEMVAKEIETWVCLAR